MIKVKYIIILSCRCFFNYFKIAKEKCEGKDARMIQKVTIIYKDQMNKLR